MKTLFKMNLEKIPSDAKFRKNVGLVSNTWEPQANKRVSVILVVPTK